MAIASNGFTLNVKTPQKNKFQRNTQQNSNTYACKTKIKCLKKLCRLSIRSRFKPLDDSKVDSAFHPSQVEYQDLLGICMFSEVLTMSFNQVITTLIYRNKVKSKTNQDQLQHWKFSRGRTFYHITHVVLFLQIQSLIAYQLLLIHKASNVIWKC